jgi:hypothetical protein
LRQRCSNGEWVGIGICAEACREFALPADVTPLGALVTACVAGGGDAHGDTQGQDAALDTDAAAVDADSAAGDAADVAVDVVADSDGAAQDGAPLDGDGADGAPLDGGAASCGDGACQGPESAATCAWDCAEGGQAAVACMLAKCPGPAQVCAAKAHCPLALAQLWWCAKGCSGCLAGCLAPLSGDVVTFSVASCSAAACLGSAP